MNHCHDMNSLSVPLLCGRCRSFRIGVGTIVHRWLRKYLLIDCPRFSPRTKHEEWKVSLLWKANVSSLSMDSIPDSFLSNPIQFIALRGRICTYLRCDKKGGIANISGLQLPKCARFILGVTQVTVVHHCKGLLVTCDKGGSGKGRSGTIVPPPKARSVLQSRRDGGINRADMSRPTLLLNFTSAIWALTNIFYANSRLSNISITSIFIFNNYSFCAVKTLHSRWTVEHVTLHFGWKTCLVWLW